MSPGRRNRSCGVSTLEGRCQGVGPWLAAGGRWGGSSWWPHGGLPAGKLSEDSCEGAKWMGSLIVSSRTEACGTTQQDPRSPGHRWTKGVDGYGAGSPWPYARAVLAPMRGHPAWHGPPCLSVWLPPCQLTRVTRGAEARPAGQSTFSTLPMIFSSKTGRTASSSRTSSNTTPQSNSSLTFLK